MQWSYTHILACLCLFYHGMFDTRHISCTFLGTLLIFAITSLTEADKYEKDLIKHLMKDYDRRVRPSRNASHSISVTFGVALAQLIDVVSCGRFY